MAPIILDPNADIAIRVVQRGPVKFKETEFKVLTAAISASPYWRHFLQHMDGASGFKPNKVHIEDTGVTVAAVEIVLRGLHQAYHRQNSLGHRLNKSAESSGKGQGKNFESVTTCEASSGTKGTMGFDAASIPNQPPTDDRTSDNKKKALAGDGEILARDTSGVDVYFPNKLFNANIDDVWGVLALVNLQIGGKNHKGKFDVDWIVVQEWFLKWRETTFTSFNTQADFEKVLFPTFAFKDSNGFRLSTKWLCQNTSVGNIAEYSPFVHSQGQWYYLHLRLPAHVMSRVRIARAALRREVSDQVWLIIRGEDGWLLHSDKCACWVVAHYNYLKALKDARVLCPELDHKSTIMELVRRIKTVEYDEPLDACMNCSESNITNNLKKASHIGSSFEGISIESLRRDGQKNWQKRDELVEALAEAARGLGV